MKEKYAPAVIALSLIAIAVTLRILPHPANFAPVGAVAIFGGAILPKRMSVLVPLLAMMISDAVIGFYSLMPLIWACYLIIALASSHWLRPAHLRKGIVLTLTASTFFFVVTNFGVWATSGMYAHTWSGLMSCYALAVPFFRNTLLSDAVYTSLLFSVYALATRAFKLRKVLSTDQITA
jgi:hypothetical protein